MGQKGALLVMLTALFAVDVDPEKDRMLIYGVHYSALKQKKFFEASERDKRMIWNELFKGQEATDRDH